MQRCAKQKNRFLKNNLHPEQVTGVHGCSDVISWTGITISRGRNGWLRHVTWLVLSNRKGMKSVSIRTLDKDTQIKAFPWKGISHTIGEIRIRITDIGTVGRWYFTVIVQITIHQFTGFRIYPITYILRINLRLAIGTFFLLAELWAIRHLFGCDGRGDKWWYKNRIQG